MVINHPTSWNKERLEEEWQKIRDEDIIEDYREDNAWEIENDVLDDEISEDEINRETDDRFKEKWGYDYNELIDKFN